MAFIEIILHSFRFNDLYIGNTFVEVTNIFRQKQIRWFIKENLTIQYTVYHTLYTKISQLYNNFVQSMWSFENKCIINSRLYI